MRRSGLYVSWRDIALQVSILFDTARGSSHREALGPLLGDARGSEGKQAAKPAAGNLSCWYLSGCQSFGADVSTKEELSYQSARLRCCVR